MPGCALNCGEPDVERSTCRRSSPSAAPVDYVVAYGFAIHGYAALELPVFVEPSRYLVIGVVVVVACEKLVLADKILAGSVRPAVPKGGADDRFSTVRK